MSFPYYFLEKLVGKVRFLARNFRFEVSNNPTEPNPVWIPVKGIVNFTLATDNERADTTDFDDDGYSSHIVVSRTGELSFEGHMIEVDEGQRLFDQLAETTGETSVAGLRIVKPNGSGVEYLGTFVTGDIGGGPNDITSWGGTFAQSGKLIREGGYFVGYAVNLYGKTGYQAEVTADGNQKTALSESAVILPVDIQARYQQTIQTHTGASVTPSGWLPSTAIDTSGFSEIGITIFNDATTSNSVVLEWSHDGVTKHGGEIVLASSARKDGAVTVPTKARYVKVSLNNGDTAPHTMSAWAYLKA